MNEDFGYSLISENSRMLSDSMRSDKNVYKRLSSFEVRNRFDAVNVIGRGNIIDEVVRFIDSGEGCFVITGDAGTGKSAIAYELSKCEKVRAVHRCEVKKPKTRRTCDVLRNLAYHLAVKDDNYAQALSRENLEDLKTEDDGDKLFDCLFREHLDGGESFALVIDGVDEMGTEEAKKLLDLLSDKRNILPNVRFILTLRNEPKLRRRWKNHIVLDEENNETAAREMLTTELNRLNIYTDERLEKIISASGSNFLYITLLLEEHESGTYRIDEYTDYPQGLDDWYLRSMERYFPDFKEYNAVYAPVLGVLCAAVSELSVEELALFIGREISETYALIEELGFAVKNEDEKYSIFHRSMIDYLTTGAKSTKYYVKSADGDKAIIAAAKSLKVNETKNSSYLSRYLFCHIFRQKDSDFAQMLYNLDDDEWVFACAAKSFQALSPREHTDFCKTVENMEDGMYLSWAIYLRLDKHRAVGAVIDLGKCLQESEKLKFDGLIFEGNGLLASDKIPAAKTAYKKAAEIAEKDKALSPSYENLKNLSMVYSKLGDIADRKNDIEDAKKYYSKSLEISEQNAVSFPSYESRRDLSASLNRMGDIALKEDNIEKAKRCYSEFLEIARQNAEDFPSYDSRRNLSASLNGMGNIALKEDKTDEAKKYYSESLEIRRQNAEDFPSYESRRDLSVSLNKIGHIYFNDNDIEKAEDYFEESLKFKKLNAEVYSSYENNRDLSKGYASLALVKKENKKYGEAKELFEEALVYAEKCREIFPCQESIGLCEAIKIDLVKLELEQVMKSLSDDSEFSDFPEMLGSLDESELSELEGKIDELLKELEESESDE